jgi:hypothetical protein
MYSRLTAVLTVLLLAVIVGDSAAQGVQTGTIRGTVRDQQGLAVPGVTVTTTSPALQQPRSTTTDVTGGYVLLALPPGMRQECTKSRSS